MRNGMEYSWNDTHRTKLKYSVETLSQCHFLHHKPHVNLPAVATVPLAWPERPEVDLGQSGSPHVARTHIANETTFLNPLNAVLNSICHLLALLGAHHIFHVSRIRFKPSPTDCFVREARHFRASEG